MVNMVNERKAPEIHFDDFDESWHDYSLKEVINVVERPFIMEDNVRYQCVTVKRRNEGVTSRGYFRGSDILVKSQFKIKTGDYLISKRQVVHGANGIVPDLLDDAIVSNEYLVFQESEMLSMEFLALLSKLPHMYEAFFLSSKGVHIEKLLFDFNDWLTRRICIPSKNEQRAIVDFFRSLDEVITLKKQQYEQSMNIKRAMLEKMFPKRGADVPEIRFDGFTEAWEVRKLEDITFKSGVKNKENLLLESYSISNEKGFVKQAEQFEKGGTMATADKTMYSIVNSKTFAYNPARINVGSIGYYDLADDVIVSSLYEVFKTTDECDDIFLWYWFKTDLFKKQIEELQEGGVRLYFFFNKFSMSSILIPSVQEQVAIGDFFRNLDTLIAAQRDELEKLQNVKKACLSKMFV